MQYNEDMDKYFMGGASSINRSFRKSLARGRETLVTLESHGFSRGSMSICSIVSYS